MVLTWIGPTSRTTSPPAPPSSKNPTASFTCNYPKPSIPPSPLLLLLINLFNFNSLYSSHFLVSIPDVICSTSLPPSPRPPVPLSMWVLQSQLLWLESLLAEFNDCVRGWKIEFFFYILIVIWWMKIQDSFTRCFKSNPPEPWNWNVYLFPLWCFGVVIRYFVLFPARLEPLLCA